MSDWVDYLVVHAAALGLARRLTSVAERHVDEACAAVALEPRERQEVLASLDRGDASVLRPALDRLRSSPLRFALLADACQMAKASGVHALASEPTLIELATTLAINRAQIDAVCAYVLASFGPPAPWGGWRSQLEDLRGAVALMEAANVPTRAVTGTLPTAGPLPSFGAGPYLGIVRLVRLLRSASSSAR